MTDAGTAFRSLRYEVADHKAYITLDRPERLSAIDRWMPLETDAPVERANDDGEVHVIVSGAKADRSARLRPRGF